MTTRQRPAGRRNGRLNENVLQTLLEELADGRPAPGELLPPEPVLVERFGVSRGVIRESLRGLEDRGVVSIMQGRGTVVRPVDGWHMLDADVMEALVFAGHAAPALRELLECRQMIEIEAAGMAAERSTDAELAELQATLAEMRACAERAEVDPRYEDRWHAADLALHECVIRATHNRALIGVFTPIQRTLHAARRPLARPDERFERGLPAHVRIVEAIQARDPAAARAAMAAHLATVSEYLYAYSERDRA
jgi:DNA-binding FadR family transcriptional regulator